MSDRIIIIRGETHIRDVFERRNGEEIHLGRVVSPIRSEDDWTPYRTVYGPGGTQDEALAWLLAPAEKAPDPRALKYSLVLFGSGINGRDYTVALETARCLSGQIRCYNNGSFGAAYGGEVRATFNTLEDAIRHLMTLDSNGCTPT